MLLMLLSGLATAWTDYLWFSSVDATSVWVTTLLSRILLGLAGFAVAALVIWINLEVVSRCKIDPLMDGGPDDEVIRRFRQ